VTRIRLTITKHEVGVEQPRGQFALWRAPWRRGAAKRRDWTYRGRRVAGGQTSTGLRGEVEACRTSMRPRFAKNSATPRFKRRRRLLGWTRRHRAGARWLI